MYPPIRIVLTGSQLATGGLSIPTNKFTLPNRVLIKGYVKTANNLPVINAAIEIIESSIATNAENSLGIVFTDDTGMYAVSLSVVNEYNYLFNAYFPL